MTYKVGPLPVLTEIITPISSVFFTPVIYPDLFLTIQRKGRLVSPCYLQRSGMIGLPACQEQEFGWIAEVGIQSPLPPRWTAHSDNGSGGARMGVDGALNHVASQLSQLVTPETK